MFFSRKDLVSYITMCQKKLQEEKPYWTPPPQGLLRKTAASRETNNAIMFMFGSLP